MRLSPPASSSDIELAREIARRLNRHRRRDDQVAPSFPEEAPTPVRRLSPPPLPPRAAERQEPEELPMRERFEPPPLREPALRSEPTRGGPLPRPPAARPHEPEPEPEPETVHVPDLAVAEGTWADEANDPDVRLATGGDAPDSAEPLDALADDAAPAMSFAAPPQAHDFAVDEPALDVDVDVEEPSPAVSEEQLVGAELEGSPLDQLAEPEPSPFDDALLDEPTPSEEPTGPSWEEIVETCRGLAQASGAMLIDPAGQVFAACGDWPAPGPNSIATKLVAMMEKTLKDAPMRSISAPLVGLHLTAWRVPLAEGLMTAAFIGRSPVKADLRPTIDAEIHRGAGA
jgi:hypothetical protein